MIKERDVENLKSLAIFLRGTFPSCTFGGMHVNDAIDSLDKAINMLATPILVVYDPRERRETLLNRDGVPVGYRIVPPAPWWAFWQRRRIEQ